MIGPYNSSVGLANLSLYRANQVLPVWLTSDYLYEGLDHYADVINERRPGFVYGRYGNPTHLALARVLALDPTLVRPRRQPRPGLPAATLTRGRQVSSGGAMRLAPTALLG